MSINNTTQHKKLASQLCIVYLGSILPVIGRLNDIFGEAFQNMVLQAYRKLIINQYISGWGYRGLC